MKLRSTFVRPAAIWLLLALLWSVLHPLVVNALPMDSGKVMICTSQGMVWLDASELDFEVPEFEKPAPQSDDHPTTQAMPCPWCQSASHLLVAPCDLDVAIRIHSPYLAYLWITVPAVHSVASDVQGSRSHPPRAPPLA